MDGKTKGPIDLIAEALAKMAAHAIESERQRDAAKEDAANWYQLYQRKDAQLKETEAKLEAEITEHQKTRQALQHALSPVQKGAG